MTDVHDHHHPRAASAVELRARALEALLAERGLVSGDAIDAVVELYENDVRPQNGAKVVARAWVDQAYRARLLNDSNRLLRSSSSVAPRVTTWLSLPTARPSTTWSCARCARVIRGRCWACRRRGTRARLTGPARCPSPRAVLREFGVELDEEVQIRVWDSNAEIRYLVLPMRPAETEGWSEDRLTAIVTRDCMIGTALPAALEPVRS